MTYLNDLSVYFALEAAHLKQLWSVSALVSLKMFLFCGFHCSIVSKMLT